MSSQIHTTCCNTGEIADFSGPPKIQFVVDGHPIAVGDCIVDARFHMDLVNLPTLVNGFLSINAIYIYQGLNQPWAIVKNWGVGAKHYDGDGVDFAVGTVFGPVKNVGPIIGTCKTAQKGAYPTLFALNLHVNAVPVP